MSRASSSMGSRPWLSERGMLAVLLLTVGVAGWPTLRALLSLANGDTPVSFVPLVALVGAALLLYLFDGKGMRRQPRDGFVDGLAAVCFLGATTVVLFILPTTMSWDYWLDRIDVLGQVLLLGTGIVILWGMPGLAQLGPALLYLLLAWPLPYLFVYNHIIPQLTDATALAVRTVVAVLPLAIRPDPTTVYGLLISFHGQTAHVVIAQACAGVNGALGLVAIGLPVAVLGQGSWASRGLWLALGVLVSWLANVLRILLIVAVATTVGPGFALDSVHPVLGMILFALSFVLLLLLAPLCGLDVAAPWRRRSEIATNPTAGGRGKVLADRTTRQPGPRRLLVLAVILGGAALVESSFSQSAWVTEAALPRVGVASPDDLFHPPPGWRLTGAQSMDGWRSLFGPSTVAAVLQVTSPARLPVDVQAILTRDADKFRTYGVEDCYTFHGFTLRAVRRLELGSGVTGTLIDFDQQGSPSAALYWLQPVQTPQGLYHERIVLIGGALDAAQRQAPRHAASLVTGASPVTGVALALADLLSPWTGGHVAPLYEAVNHQLQSLGQAVILQGALSQQLGLRRPPLTSRQVTDRAGGDGTGEARLVGPTRY